MVNTRGPVLESSAVAQGYSRNQGHKLEVPYAVLSDCSTIKEEYPSFVMTDSTMGNRRHRPRHSLDIPGDNSMDSMDLDDLISLKSDDQSPRDYSASDGAMSQFARPQQSYCPHSSNAIHMEVQENSKVPAYNMRVCRRNSSHSRHESFTMTPSARRQIGEAMDDGTNSTATSLAELFLGNNERHSLNLTYERAAGSLLSDIPDGRRKSLGRPSSFAESTDVLDAIAASVEPTPLSEIKMKSELEMEKANRRHAQEQAVAVASRTGQTTSTSQPNRTEHPHRYTYYPYGRPYQLPIPSAPLSSPPAQSGIPPPPTLADAVATAAVIAQSQQRNPKEEQEDKPQRRRSSASSTSRSSGRSPVPSTSYPSKETSTTKTSPVTVPAPAPVPFYHSQRSAYSPPPHSAAHVSGSGAIANAAKQQRNYGFGGDHSVPSTHPMPQRKPAPRTSPTPSTRNGTPTLSSLPKVGAHGANTGAAYERKKQRAKDARVKLNESIERLSLAISVAGTQSKQRQTQLLHLQQTEQHAKSIEFMEECVKTATAAKKWDRPSFVGTAAALIQALNSQCDSLMKSIFELEERQASFNGNGAVHAGQKHDTDDDIAGITGDAKRMRIEWGEPADNGIVRSRTSPIVPQQSSFLFSEKNVVEHIASFLGPLSLLRSVQVSREWRATGAFQKDVCWRNLAIKRFGFSNVRQWLETAEGDEEKVSFRSNNLYRSMDEANVMPRFKHEGMELLGSARIPGKVSAWAFLVERSNGETTRSVKLPPFSSTDATGSGRYTSLPVVELRIVIQNTGVENTDLVVKEQSISVDASTRRRGESMAMIDWDDRFDLHLANLDGTLHYHESEHSSLDVQSELCRLKLFDAVMMVAFIHARGCSSTTKFRRRCNFTQVLASLDGALIPIVIPFKK